MVELSQTAILVVAAGSGQRAGGGVPKQYRLLAGMPVLARTLRIFARFGFGTIVPVIGSGQDTEFEQVLTALTPEERRRIAPPVLGGTTRQGSVLNGLLALEQNRFEHVLIHDGARALSPISLIHNIISSLKAHKNVIPALTIIDTVKQVSADGTIITTHDRNALRTVQTPQAFEFKTILAAHKRADLEQVQGLTDDAAIMEWAGIPVQTIEGHDENIKITTEADFAKAERMILKSLEDIRVGQGYDVHSFEPGDHVWLGGVKIPHSHKLNGHSDSDVLLHAMTDAILGALGDGDIGVHFPPSEEQWRGAPSKLFLQDAMARLLKRGGILAHLDGTLVCEAPKIGPHREAMRAEIAAITGISLDRVGLKATTAEKLGFVGRREGIEAYATATIRLP